MLAFWIACSEPPPPAWVDPRWDLAPEHVESGLKLRTRVGRAGVSPIAACEALRTATDLAGRLDDHLRRRRATSADAAAFDASLAALPTALPGLRVLGDGASTVVAVDYVELAAAVGGGPIEDDLVSVGALVSPDAGWRGDGCTHPEKAVVWFGRLAHNWEKATVCFQDRVQPLLADVMAEICERPCPSSDRESVLPKLAAHVVFGGPRCEGRWVATPPDGR